MNSRPDLGRAGPPRQVPRVESNVSRPSEHVPSQVVRLGPARLGARFFVPQQGDRSFAVSVPLLAVAGVLMATCVTQFQAAKQLDPAPRNVRGGVGHVGRHYQNSLLAALRHSPPTLSRPGSARHSSEARLRAGIVVQCFRRMSRLLTPVLLFVACYAWYRYARGSAQDRGRLVGILGWGAGLSLIMFFAVRSGQLLLAAVLALVLVGLRLLPQTGSSAAPKESGSASGRAPRAAMSRADALRVLDLAEGATPDEINARYRQLIKAVHPDRGGSSYLATQLNMARHVLLGSSTA